MWDCTDGQCIQTLLHDRVSGAVFSTDGSRVLTISNYDGIAKLWRSTDGQCIQTLLHVRAASLSSRHSFTTLARPPPTENVQSQS